MVHSQLRFSQLLLEPELIIEQWVTLYYMGAFTPAVRSTIGWTEKFNNRLCIDFLQLHGLKSSRNSSRLKKCRCELSLTYSDSGLKIVTPTGCSVSYFLQEVQRIGWILYALRTVHT